MLPPKPTLEEFMQTRNLLLQVGNIDIWERLIRALNHFHLELYPKE